MNLFHVSVHQKYYRPLPVGARTCTWWMSALEVKVQFSCSAACAALLLLLSVNDRSVLSWTRLNHDHRNTPLWLAGRCLCRHLRHSSASGQRFNWIRGNHSNSTDASGCVSRKLSRESKKTMSQTHTCSSVSGGKMHRICILNIKG